MSNWINTIGTGKNNEQLTKQILAEHGYTKITDVSDDSNYYHKGDFIVEGLGLVDAKNDWQIGKWGNFALELSINRDKNQAPDKEKQGWFYVATYDYLIFNDSQSKIMYVLDFRALQQVGLLLCKKKTKNWNYHEQAWLEIGVLPVNVARDNGLIKAEWSY